MNLINTDGISINMLLSKTLAMLVAISIFVTTTTSGLLGGIASPVAGTSNIENGNRNRAKSGPTAVQTEHRSSQAPLNESVTNNDAFATERPGFEPGIRV